MVFRAANFRKSIKMFLTSVAHEVVHSARDGAETERQLLVQALMHHGVN